MALLIDTDLLIDLERGAKGAATPPALPAEELAISVITVSELLHGVLRADETHRASRQAFVERIIERLAAVEITSQIARTHARLWVDMASRGVVTGAHDLWVAASAVTLGYGVATNNVADYRRVPGLRVVGPGD